MQSLNPTFLTFDTAILIPQSPDKTCCYCYDGITIIEPIKWLIESFHPMDRIYHERLNYGDAMKFLSAALLLITGFFVSNAFASSWYIGADGDVALPRSNTITGSTDGSVDYKSSSEGGDVALGYEPQSLSGAMGDVRLEVQGGYHPFKLQDVIADGVSSDSNGNLRIATLMGNAYFDLRTNSGLTPYVGAGAGDAYIDFARNNGFDATKSQDNRLGYQLMGGVSYTMPSMPKLDWSVGYRYLGTTGPQFATTTGDIKFDALHASNVEAGIKYHF